MPRASSRQRRLSDRDFVAVGPGERPSAELFFVDGVQGRDALQRLHFGRVQFEADTRKFCSERLDRFVASVDAPVELAKVLVGFAQQCDFADALVGMLRVKGDVSLTSDVTFTWSFGSFFIFFGRDVGQKMAQLFETLFERIAPALFSIFVGLLLVGWIVRVCFKACKFSKVPFFRAMKTRETHQHAWL